MPSAERADRELSSQENASIIVERKRDLEADQDELAEAIEAAGGRVDSRLWVGGSSIIATLPAGKVGDFALFQGVTLIELDREAGESAVAYHLKNAADGIRSMPFINAGYDGSAHGRSGSGNRLRIGILEHDADGGCTDVNYPVTTHQAFRDSHNGAFRWALPLARCRRSIAAIQAVVLWSRARAERRTVSS